MAGKSKRKFNSKARQIEDKADDQSRGDACNITIEFAEKPPYTTDDGSNILVLPSKRQKLTKKEKLPQNAPKKLTRKQRKNLQRIVDQKKKKANRAELLESLGKCQASNDELALFSSAAHMGQKVTKRQAEERQKLLDVSGIKGSNRRKRKKATEGNESSPEEASDEEDIQDEQSDSDEDEDEKSDEDFTTEEQETGSDMKELKSVADSQEAVSNVKSGQEGKEILDENTSQKDNLKEAKQQSQDKVEAKPAVFVTVERDPEIQEARLSLPILAEEQEIMEKIQENHVVIISGETGSGKTTQVPQFLYEAGYAMKGMIGITEPRRVAAITMSHRVAKEMSLPRKVVSYQIRYEGNVTEKTKMKFMTDGVLLKEIQRDFLLTHYSAIIIDEAHERSVYTDILIGLLSRIVPLREKKNNPLKLIIMSATLRVEDFTLNTRLFKQAPPVVKVDARQHPVTVHFNKRTPVEDYISEAFKKIMKIHRTLPPGGILVFVTGQHEVTMLCRKLREVYTKRNHPSLENQEDESKQIGDPECLKESRGGEQMVEREQSEETWKAFKKKKLPKFSLDSYSVQPNEEPEADEADIEEDEITQDEDINVAPGEESGDEDDKMNEALQPVSEDEVPLYVLPMFSLLSPQKQAQVFGPTPEDQRLCVVATNVAETSLTIPGIKYVVDTGRVKKRHYDKVTGISSFKVGWTSKASANQRAGRAGRTEPGHCYRLYSSAVFGNDFPTFDLPEITRRPVEDLVLQMKDMGIDKVVNFPYPSPPDMEALKASERLLLSLGALEELVTTSFSAKDLMKESFNHSISSLGRAMACFPVSPCYAKMIALGKQHDCLPYIIALVSALTVREIFESATVTGSTEQEKMQHRKRQERIENNKRVWAGKGPSLLLGDLMVLLGAVGATEYAGNAANFCGSHGIRYKAMAEIRKLRRLLTNAVNSVDPDCSAFVDPKMNPPSNFQIKMLRQIVTVGLAHHVARRVPATQEDHVRGSYHSVGIEGDVFIHPSSVLFKEEPQFVVYQEIIETSKPYMKGVTAIEADWLPHLVPHLCTFAKPQVGSETYDKASGTVRCLRACTFGRNVWQISVQEMEYPECLDKYKWFAKFLLEGEVVDQLKKFRENLLSTPSTMVKTWAKLQPRTQVLLNALVQEQVCSKEALMEAWKKNDRYLLKELCEWLPSGKHTILALKWPPVTQSGKSTK
ncbi:probable ATP-dependent RNA helicase DHX37 isoform X3 [Apostichopus japonicus]|uniref:probable ATP-dependent RNA helicase DHX37 isoform X3 n=1 Tax=Stichopus japonicus TaxID=307972 RepID=UPI003AB6CDC4